MTHVENYKRLLQDIHTLALKSDRSPENVKLVVVSKGRSVPEIFELYKAGCRSFGESRLQEAASKIAALPQDIEWHLIGSLQKNKVAKAIQLFTLIHSIDSFELAKAVSTQSLKAGSITRVLIQLNITRESSKHGFLQEDFLAYYDQLQALPGIKIEGLMMIGPQTECKEEIFASFRSLKTLGEAFGLKEFSMGMSQDFTFAIETGATLLRVGSKIFL